MNLYDNSSADCSVQFVWDNIFLFRKAHMRATPSLGFPSVAGGTQDWLHFLPGRRRKTGVPGEAHRPPIWKAVSQYEYHTGEKSPLAGIEPSVFTIDDNFVTCRADRADMCLTWWPEQLLMWTVKVCMCVVCLCKNGPASNLTFDVVFKLPPGQVKTLSVWCQSTMDLGLWLVASESVLFVLDLYGNSSSFTLFVRSFETNLGRLKTYANGDIRSEWRHVIEYAQWLYKGVRFLCLL